MDEKSLKNKDQNDWNKADYFLFAVLGIAAIAGSVIFWKTVESASAIGLVPTTTEPEIASSNDPVQTGFGSGVFGDAFGYLNAAFTGFAFLLLALSVIFQRKELRTTQDDRDLTKLALRDQTETNDRLWKEAERTRKQAAFYQLLEMLAKTQPSDELRSFTPTPESTLKIGERHLSGLFEAQGKGAISYWKPFYAVFLAAVDIQIDPVFSKDEQANMEELLLGYLTENARTVAYLYAMNRAIVLNEDIPTVLESEMAFLLQGDPEMNGLCAAIYNDPT